MELGTFGAVMGFASHILAQSGEFYAVASERAKGPDLRQALRALQERADRDCSFMERIRRENVTEMILEPIAALRREEYEVSLGEGAPQTDAEILRTALLLEDRDHRFFRDSSAKLPLPEVARLMRKIAARKEAAIGKLRALTG